MPACCAAADVTFCVSSEPSARYCGFTWLMLISPLPRRVPLTPTYAASMRRRAESACCTLKVKFWNIGGRPSPGPIMVTLVPFCTVGLMNGGFGQLVGKPLSQLNAGVTPASVEA